MDRYPRGKLCDDDDGALNVAITVKDKTLVIAFSEPSNWIGMDYATAVNFAQTILRHAEQIRPDRCEAQ